MTKRTCLLTAALLLSTAALNAQTTFGTIAGVVRDPGKAPIGGATITATKLDGNSIRTTISGSDGIYTFSDVVPGNYSIIAQTDKFGEITVASIQVVAGRAARTDIAATGPMSAPAVISSATPRHACASGTGSARGGAGTTLSPATHDSQAANAPSTRLLAPDRAGNPAGRRDIAQERFGSRHYSLVDSAAGGVRSINRRPIRRRRRRRRPPMPPNAGAAPAAAPVDLQTPFAFADFTWMMAVPRNHDSVFDGKYFSGEFRWDTNYIYDYNHPIDHTLGGTTEGTRTGEIVLQGAELRRRLPLGPHAGQSPDADRRGFNGCAAQ